MNERASPSSVTGARKSPAERKAILDGAFAGTLLKGAGASPGASPGRAITRLCSCVVGGAGTGFICA